MAKSRRHPHRSPNLGGAAPANSHEKTSAVYEVVLSQAAEAAYERFYKRAVEARDRGESTSSHFTALNMIDEVLERVIPHDPFNKRYALQGTLSGMFRMKKGRLRIVWVGNSDMRKVVVVFISETLRKDGDANDPYKLLTGMVLSGEYDHIFKELGLPSPSKVPKSTTYPFFQ